MRSALRTLEMDEIQSLEPGSLVELNGDGKILTFLGKGAGESRIAYYSFLLSDGGVKKFKGTMMLRFNGIRKVEP